MARKLTITLIVLCGLLGLGSSRSAFADDDSFAFDEEEARFYDQEEAQAYDEEASRAYNEALAEFKSQYEESRRSEEGPPRPLEYSDFCKGRKDGNYADVTNPRAFYMCDKAGKTWIMNCQAGLVFDQAHNRCEWAQGNNGGQQNSYQYQSYVPLSAKETYVSQHQQQEIYVPQQPIKQTYVTPKVPVQINGYGR